MGVIATETWTGTTGAAWPSQWTAKFNGVTTIQSNQGQLVPNNTAANTGARVDLTGMAAMMNTDVYVEVTAVTAGVDQYAWVGVNCDANAETGAGNSPYQVYLELDYKATSTASTVSAWQGTNSAATAITRTLTGGVKYGVRVRRYNSAFYMRSWDASGVEPTAWDFTIATSSLPGANVMPNPIGIVSFGCQNGGATGARAIQFDNMTVDDLGTTTAWLRI